MTDTSCQLAQPTSALGCVQYPIKVCRVLGSGGVREGTAEVTQASSNSSSARVREGGGEEGSQHKGNFHTDWVREMQNMNS